jgi:hypothetical protein
MEYYNHLSLYSGDSSRTWYNLRKAVWIRLIKSTGPITKFRIKSGYYNIPNI